MRKTHKTHKIHKERTKMHKGGGMQIILNGETYSTSARSIAELIEEVGVRAKTIALAQNTQVVREDGWSETPLREGDEIEILQFMGGG